MTFEILATGSSGNAVIINGEILIDCGVPYKTLERSGYIKGLKLVLLTHQHGDHFKPATVRALHRERPALRWGCCEWMVPLLAGAGVSSLVIDVYAKDLHFFYPRTSIQDVAAFQTIHDVPNCAWKIQAHGERLFYATDTATLDHIEAKNYDYYLIEANHTQAEIAARIAEKQAHGEFAYEYRAAQNHLSQEQAMDWLALNMGPNSKYVFLHQHKEKNHV